MKNKEFKTITIDGVEYYTKKQVAEMTGMTVQSIDNKIRGGLNLSPLKLPNKRCLLPKEAVESAISQGRLMKWF